MVELTNVSPCGRPELRQALNRGGGGLLLAQGSDWAFIMKAGSHVEYAVRRNQGTPLRFTPGSTTISKRNRIDEGWLRDIEYGANIFPDVIYRVCA